MLAEGVRRFEFDELDLVGASLLDGEGFVDLFARDNTHFGEHAADLASFEFGRVHGSLQAKGRRFRARSRVAVSSCSHVLGVRLGERPEILGH